MVSYAVVGAGLAGLTLASEFMKYGVDFEVFEYRDYAGGVHILDNKLLSEIMEITKNININYGASLLSINNKPIIVSRKGSMDVIGKSLIIATGFRVMTLVELGIYGDRPAGIYTFHAAVDLIRSGLLPGRNVVVYGDNNYALLLAKKLIGMGESVLMVTPKEIKDASNENVRIGRVKYVKGTYRVEKILIDDEWVKADTLIISMFKPHNPMPNYPAIGQAVIETYEAEVIKESAKIMAKELISTDDYITIISDVPVFPSTGVHRDTRRVIIDYNGKLLINDKEVVINKPTVIELPDTDKVEIRRVM